MIDIENTMSDDLGFKKDVELIFINKYSKDSIINNGLEKVVMIMKRISSSLGYNYNEIYMMKI